MKNTKNLLNKIGLVKDCRSCSWDHQDENVYQDIKGIYYICPMTKKEVYLAISPPLLVYALVYGIELYRLMDGDAAQIERNKSIIRKIQRQTNFIWITEKQLEKL